MAARKTKPTPNVGMPVVLDRNMPADTVVIVPHVAAFADLDPVDGRPVFAEGLSRRRWLELHADERKAELLAELLADPGKIDDTAAP